MEAVTLRTGFSGPVVVLTAFFLPGVLHAQWSENFDSYRAGSEVIGQGDWAGWDNNRALGALVSDREALSAPNSLALKPGTDVVRRFNFTGGRLSIRAQVFIPSDHTGAAWVVLLNRYQPFGANNNWSGGIRFRDGMVTSHGGGNFFSRAGTGIPLVADRWTELRIDVDLGKSQQTVYYGGKLLHEAPWHYDGSESIQAIDLSDGVGMLNFLFSAGSPHPLTVPGSQAACANVPGCQDQNACQ